MELLKKIAFDIWETTSLRFITLGKFTQIYTRDTQLQEQNCFNKHVYICRQQGRSNLNKYQCFDKVSMFHATHTIMR